MCTPLRSLDAMLEGGSNGLRRCAVGRVCSWLSAAPQILFAARSRTRAGVGETWLRRAPRVARASKRLARTREASLAGPKLGSSRTAASRIERATLATATACAARISDGDRAAACPSPPRRLQRLLVVSPGSTWPPGMAATPRAGIALAVHPYSPAGDRVVAGKICGPEWWLVSASHAAIEHFEHPASRLSTLSDRLGKQQRGGMRYSSLRQESLHARQRGYGV